MGNHDKIQPKEQQDVVMTASLSACRCLTDTLVQVPSGEAHEELEMGRSVRQQVVGLVCQHLSALAFPQATGEHPACQFQLLCALILCPHLGWEYSKNGDHSSFFKYWA